MSYTEDAMNAYEIKAAWLSAGGSPHLADTMTAIALAESKGHIMAWNHTDPFGGSYGLWQINGCWSNRFNPHALRRDPFYNAQAAIYVVKHQGLNAWSTHANGAYLRFMHSTRYAPYRKVHHARVSHHKTLAHVDGVSYASAFGGYFGFIVIGFTLARKFKESIRVHTKQRLSKNARGNSSTKRRRVICTASA
jgi:hypothetical protein